MIVRSNPTIEHQSGWSHAENVRSSSQSIAPMHTRFNSSIQI